MNEFVSNKQHYCLKRNAAEHYQRKKDYMNYKVMLAKILSEKELADMDIKKIKEDDALLEELIRKEYALVVDWSGEEGDNYLFNFFNQRTVSLLGRQLDISSNEVYQQFDKDMISCLLHLNTLTNILNQMV